MRFIRHFKELGAFPVMSGLILLSLALNAMVILGIVFLYHSKPIQVDAVVDHPLEIKPIEVRHRHEHQTAPVQGGGNPGSGASVEQQSTGRSDSVSPQQSSGQNRQSDSNSLFNPVFDRFPGNAIMRCSNKKGD